MVDLGGFEPPTSSMPWKRAPNCATGPFRAAKLLLEYHEPGALYHGSDRPPMARPTPIRFESAGYRIGQARLVDDLSFEVRQGETLALLGRSGSGKTTALRLVNRLIEPTSGRVLVHGRPTEDWDPIALRRSIGYVIQDVGLFPHFTVARNIGLVPRLEGRDEAWIAGRVRELLALVGLEPDDVAERRPSQLSGGQRQRVGVARALAADPPILLMDEPFGALDPITRREIQREFLDLEQRLDKTILFVTHDVSEALLLAGRIAVLDAGRLVWLGSTDEFRLSEDARILAFRESAA